MIEIIVPGKISKHLQEAVDYYVKVLGKFSKVNLTFVPLGGDLNVHPRDAVLKREAEHLLKKVSGRRYVLLDLHGEEMSSEEFANFVERRLFQDSYLVFVVGGPLGVHDDLRKGATLRISLSTFTLTHELCVLVLLEQLFRAFKMIRGERYHY